MGFVDMKVTDNSAAYLDSGVKEKEPKFIVSSAQDEQGLGPDLDPGISRLAPEREQLAFLDEERPVGRSAYSAV